MNKLIKLLFIILSLQVVLTGIVFYSYGYFSTEPETISLIGLKKDNIKKIILEGPSSKKVELENTNGKWVLPKKNNFPANSAQINQLLDRLTETKLGSKISQQASSHSRLRVSEEEFERKLTISNDEQRQTTIFFGSAPSLRQSHARILDKDEVYIVKFSANDIDILSNDWLKKDIFVISQSQIKKIKYQNITLEKLDDDKIDSINPEMTGSQWRVKGLNKKKHSPEALYRFINNLADMRINGIASNEEIKKIDKSQKPIRFDITLTDDSKIFFQLSKLTGEEDFLMTTSQKNGAYRLPPLSAKELISSSQQKSLLGELQKNLD